MPDLSRTGLRPAASTKFTSRLRWPPASARGLRESAATSTIAIMSQNASFYRVDGGSRMARVAQALNCTLVEDSDAHARPRAGASFLYKGIMALLSTFYGVVADARRPSSPFTLYCITSGARFAALATCVVALVVALCYTVRDSTFYGVVAAARRP